MGVAVNSCERGEQTTLEISRLPVLDGWRALSIFSVLISHMLPLGPMSWHINGVFALLGMSLFFTLSGFLMASILISRPSVKAFLIRRLCRILPLAWLFMSFVLILNHSSLSHWTANFLFYANIPPFWLVPHAGHLWSLCVEIQFYFAIALSFYMFRQQGLLLMIFFAFFITGLRVWCHVHATISTYFRADEILVGCWLALIYSRKYSFRYLEVLFKRIHPVYFLVLLITSSHQHGDWIMYFRPYFAMMLIGSTLYQKKIYWHSVLESSFLKYIAAISYAVYILHPLTTAGWLGLGSKTQILLFKRPISLFLTFSLAHVSTFYYERYWIRFGKKWSDTVLKSENKMA